MTVSTLGCNFSCHPQFAQRFASLPDETNFPEIGGVSYPLREFWSRLFVSDYLSPLHQFDNNCV